MKREKLYIAGPMCFYEDGYPRWYVMRDRARVKGFDVTMPSDGELDLSHEDLRKNGDAIFENCARCMNESTAILCNLEFYRGADVDGGSVYEVGMAYARGAHCYGYTRDKRPMVWKYQGSVLRDGTAYDRKGRPLPYGDLPFSPNVVGAMKIVEGDFDDCLQVFALDREEERKRAAFAPPPPPPAAENAPGTDGRPVVYVAGPERYDPDAQNWYASVRALGDRLGCFGSSRPRTRSVRCPGSWRTTPTPGPTTSSTGSSGTCGTATSSSPTSTISTAGSRTATPPSSAAWPSSWGRSCTGTWTAPPA